MKLPEKMKVGAMVYTVQIVPNMLSERSMYGEVIYGQQIIKIAGDISEARQFNAFLHELTHAILFESGDTNDQEDEAFVRRFSNLLTQVFVDNGWSIEGG